MHPDTYIERDRCGVLHCNPAASTVLKASLELPSEGLPSVRSCEAQSQSSLVRLTVAGSVALLHLRRTHRAVIPTIFPERFLSQNCARDGG